MVAIVAMAGLLVGPPNLGQVREVDRAKYAVLVAEGHGRELSGALQLLDEEVPWRL